MPDFRKLLVVLIILSIGLIVLLLWLPRQPASALEKAQNPADPDSLRLMQAVELVNGPNPMQGIQMLRDMVQKDSTNVDAHYWLGVFAVKSGQLDKAVSRFETILAIDPKHMEACIDLGRVYLQMDSTAKAMEYFDRGIAIDSTNNYALLFAAQAKEQMGMPAEAVARYRQLLRHNTDTVVTKRINEFIDNINKKLNP